MQTQTNQPDLSTKESQAGQTAIAQQNQTSPTTAQQSSLASPSSLNATSGTINQAKNQSSTTNQQAKQPYTYKPTTNTSDNLNQLLNSDSLHMQQAKQQGLNTAASRGLINSSIAAGASQQAAINAAAPMAQQDANSQLQQWNTEKTVQANLQGAYVDSVNQSMHNAMINVSNIETTQGLKQAEKDKMIKATLERRDADMAFLKTMYSAMPTWANNWSSFPSMPDAPGVTMPDPEA